MDVDVDVDRDDDGDGDVPWFVTSRLVRPRLHLALDLTLVVAGAAAATVVVPGLVDDPSPSGALHVGWWVVVALVGLTSVPRDRRAWRDPEGELRRYHELRRATLAQPTRVVVRRLATGLAALVLLLAVVGGVDLAAHGRDSIAGWLALAGAVVLAVAGPIGLRSTPARLRALRPPGVGEDTRGT